MIERTKAIRRQGCELTAAPDFAKAGTTWIGDRETRINADALYSLFAALNKLADEFLNYPFAIAYRPKLTRAPAHMLILNTFQPKAVGLFHIPTILEEIESMFWKIVLVLGVLGILLGILVTGVSIALPFVTDGRTSWDEAIFGIVPGLIVLVISFFVFLPGLIFVIVNRRKRLTQSTPGGPGQMR